jgi:hypothetical protein
VDIRPNGEGKAPEKDDDTFRLDAVSTKVWSRMFDKIDRDAVGKQGQ